MAEIIPMTEEQKFKLEIYRLLSKNNSAAEEAFAFIGADQLKLELFKLHTTMAVQIQTSHLALSKRCVNRRKR